MTSKDLFQCLRVLPTDYEDYGGEVKRWADPDLGYPDCSVGCKFFVPLVAPYTYDWGICSKPGAPRAAMANPAGLPLTTRLLGDATWASYD